ncbi:MAG TPA: sensor histidine kinase, partial [Puia sp.]|nr:sensor histidine kinase [Puia sp.]
NELLRFRVDSAMGSFVSAIRHYQVYKNMEDSLLNVNKSRQIVEMQAKYESRQKEQEIMLLQTQRKFIIGGVVLLLIIVGLLYSAYRAKQRHNLEKDKLLTEKDWLLKEIHHRVKNNLQIITSLLKTQSHFLEDGCARNAIRETLNRVQSMSLIHHKLYTESNFSTIDLPAYIADLISHLRNSFSDLSKNVNFRHKVESIRMEAAQLIPIGLILNEAITNSIKYAFQKEGGAICISLLATGPNRLELTISDNGIGLPEDFDTRSIRSLGMKMIRMLTKQLDGKIMITGNPGVKIVVQFPLKYQHHE